MRIGKNKYTHTLPLQPVTDGYYASFRPLFYMTEVWGPTLLDLPNEVLLIILEGSSQTTIRRINATSHRLRLIAQSIIFKRQISHLKNLVVHGLLSFHGNTIDQLFNAGDLGFPPHVSMTVRYDETLFEDLISFFGLLSNLEHIGRVDLELSHSHMESLNRNPRWPYLLAAALNLIAEKSRSRLVVTRGSGWGHMERPFDYKIQSPTTTTSIPQAKRNLPTSDNAFRQFVQPVFRLFERLKSRVTTRRTTVRLVGPTSSAIPLQVSRDPRPCRVVLSPSSSPILEELYIHSSVLLYLPFFSWTMHLLDIAPIKKLSFQFIDLIHYDWEHILSLITIPTLSHLSIGHCSVAFPDLQKFLMRHPSITSLDLSRNTAIGYLGLSSSEVMLPRLTELVANPEYLCHFLQSSEAFPALESVTINSEYDLILRTYDYSQFNPVLDCIAKRAQEIHLTLMCISLADLSEWLRSINAKLAKAELRPIPHIIKLKIQANCTAAIIDDITNFIALFPSVRNITLCDPLMMTETFDLWGALWDLYPQLETINDIHRPE